MSDFAGPTRREANGGGAPESDLVTPESFVHGRPLAPRLRRGRLSFLHQAYFKLPQRGSWHQPSSRPNHKPQLNDGDEAHETARLDRRRDQALDGACAPEQECAGHCEAAWTLHSFRQTTRASIGLASAAKQRWTTVLNPRSTVQKGPSDKATAVMRKRPSRDRWPVLDLDPIRRLAGAVGSMAPLA